MREGQKETAYSVQNLENGAVIAPLRTIMIGTNDTGYLVHADPLTYVTMTDPRVWPKLPLDLLLRCSLEL